MKRALVVVMVLIVTVATQGSTRPPRTNGIDCWYGCWTIVNSSRNTLNLGTRDGDTDPTVWIRPGHRSHRTTGGDMFYVPAGCRAKTSQRGRYWAHWGWHRAPHHRTTVVMHPWLGMRKHC